MKTLSYVEIEQVFLDKWSHAMKKDNASPEGSSSCGISTLEAHGYIQQEKVVVYIYPSCKNNLINTTLAKRLHVPSQHILSTQVDGETMEIFELLNVSMGNNVFHSNFHVQDMDNVDMVLHYPWLDSVGTVNLDVQKKFLKLWYKKNEITLQDIFLSKPVEPKRVYDIVSIGTLEVIPIDISND